MNTFVKSVKAIQSAFRAATDFVTAPGDMFENARAFASLEGTNPALSKIIGKVVKAVVISNSARKPAGLALNSFGVHHFEPMPA